jgi:hypothetical protein
MAVSAAQQSWWCWSSNNIHLEEAEAANHNLAAEALGPDGPSHD